jgi:hypothetical protein
MPILSPQEISKNRAGGHLYRFIRGVPPYPTYVDPRAVQVVSKSSDADPYGVDPRAVQLVR